MLGVDTFSCHADADEVLAWLSTAPRTPDTCFVVHGEPAASATLAHRIVHDLHWCAVAPRHDERIRT